MLRFSKNVITVIKGFYEEPHCLTPKSFSSVESQLKEAMSPLTVEKFWSCSISHALSLGFHREKDSILVADRNKQLHVLRLDGSITGIVSLPAKFIAMETGWHHTYRTLILGNTGYRLYVLDDEGRVLWRYLRWFWGSGINEAHWGDINGDGNDEIIVGLNGWGGLLAFTIKGKPLWTVKKNGNVWSHAIIASHPDKQALVLATDASGHISTYAHNGQFIRTLGPKEEYFTRITASVVPSLDCIQIVALVVHNQTFYEVMAIDFEGRIVWKTPVTPMLINRIFACEDINGDGVGEWVFIEQANELVVVSHKGEKLASLAGQAELDDFLIVPRTDGHGMLVTLQSGTLNAYQFR